MNKIKKLLRKLRLWTATEAELEREVGAGVAGQKGGKRFFGLKIALPWIFILTCGCSMSITVGGGNRTASTYATHAEIPETIAAHAPIAESAANGAATALLPTLKIPKKTP